MKNCCPSCGRKFGFFSGPKLKSWRRDPARCACPACDADLVVTSTYRIRKVVFCLVALALLACARLVAFNFLPATFALPAYLFIGLAIAVGLCLVIVHQAEFERLKKP